MADRFEDDRGIIEDLLITPLDGVTRITTRTGAVRGNHVHQHTQQWTYVISGRLLTAVHATDGGLPAMTERGPGDLIFEPAGLPHAWRAVSDCEVLVFTKGPRLGSAYEDDVVRLPQDQRLL